MMLKILLAISTQLEVVVAKRQRGKLMKISFLVMFVNIVGQREMNAHVLLKRDKREKREFLRFLEVSDQQGSHQQYVKIQHHCSKGVAHIY